MHAPRTFRRLIGTLALSLVAGCSWPAWMPWGTEAPPPPTPIPGEELPPAPDPAPPIAGEPGADAVLGEDDVFRDEASVETFGYGDAPVIRVQTSDGWNLAVYHYPPPGAFAKLYPVVLVHGEGFNRFIWDFDEKRSLARDLAENLYDTWVVELRGHGHSRVDEAAPSPVTQWIFEDYVTDVNAAIDFVLAQTGATQVNLIGHSTGGVIVYGMMENEQYARKIATGVSVSAPTLFRFANDTMTSLFIHREKVYGQEYVDLRDGLFVPAPFAENTETVYSVLLFNDRHMDPDMVERFADLGLEKVRVDVLKQFADWFAEEKAYSTEDQSFNYNDDLNLIRAPLCVFVGWRDNIAQPENVIESLKLVEPSLLTLQLFGKMDGHQDYYGHTGMLLNDYAHVDVYPRVAQCLDDAALKLTEGFYSGPSYSAPREEEKEPPTGFGPPPSEEQPPLEAQPEQAPEEGLPEEQPAIEEPAAPESEEIRLPEQEQVPDYTPGEGMPAEEIPIEEVPQTDILSPFEEPPAQ